MKTKIDLISSWLDKAEKDLISAKHELTQTKAVTETICFHSQQAVEKFLKAYLVFLELPFSKTHEIGYLITKCEKVDKEISVFKEEADKLTDYAVDIRYPDDWYEPTITEAKESIKIADTVKKFVLAKIKPNNK
jgi:HEPN domain-containing protein